MNDIEFKKIMEAVNQGIVSSKQSESQFWGEFKDWRKEKDERDNQMIISLVEIRDEIKALKEAKVIQNGRLAKCENNLSDVNSDISSAKGSIRSILFISSLFATLLVGLVGYIYNRTETNIDEVSQLIHTHILQ